MIFLKEKGGYTYYLNGELVAGKTSLSLALLYSIMSKYPYVLFFRFNKYNDADTLVEGLNCTVKISSNPSDIERLYSGEYHILATYGPTDNEYYNVVEPIICSRINKRWIHFSKIDREQFERGINYCYIHNVIRDRLSSRTQFSVFTTCFNSFSKIDRPYKSLKSQTNVDWEWVILDDSDDEKHFAFLKEKFKNEPKIRLYNRSKNSGSIGEVKNEAVALCRGEFILELDHDDEIAPNLIKDAVGAFRKYPDVDFVYMDFTNLYEDRSNFSYNGFMCKGFGGYYYEFYEPTRSWVLVYCSPQINNITASYIYCMPNHPRIWRREKLLQFGSYSELLPICDDQEILLRTFVQGKTLKIPKLAYVQYMNNGGSNFSLIRNSEINRIGPEYLSPQFKELYNLDARMQELNALHRIEYDQNPVRLWERGDDFVANYANYLYHPDYDKQYCIIGKVKLVENVALLKDLNSNPRNDFILLDNEGTDETLFVLLDLYGFKRFKCYVLNGSTEKALLNYFHRIYRSTEQFEII